MAERFAGVLAAAINERRTPPYNVPKRFRGNISVSLAYEDGFKAGEMGLSRNVNPFGPYNRNLCAAWDEGWRDGRDTLTTDKEG